MNKTILYHLLALLLLFGIVTVNAQVTIGSGKKPEAFSVLELDNKTKTIDKGGLRLPHLTTKERDDLSAKQTFKNESHKGNPDVIPIIEPGLALGLTIFNTSTNCIEYWNGTKWISLCSSNANITLPGIDFKFEAYDPSIPSMEMPPPAKTSTPVATPQCNGLSIPFSFTIQTGIDYTRCDVQDELTGKFSISMDANPTAKTRSAILRVTNNCTGEHKDFLFVQQANIGKCEVGATPPNINYSNNGKFCDGGAVYMDIVAPNPAWTYIWTLNDITMGEGTTYVATRPGNYVVYTGAKGCPDGVSAPVTVIATGAPAPVNPIELYVSNDGVICGGKKVDLIAYGTPMTGTLKWYRNGIETAKTGSRLELGAGDVGEWTAVIVDGDCYSTQSQSVTISEGSSSSISLQDPVVFVNGQSLTGLTSFCKGGRLDLSLNNLADYAGIDIDVEWLNGLTSIGTGRSISTVAPIDGSLELVCVVRDNNKIHCDAEVRETRTIIGEAPPQPSISADPKMICGVNTSSLTANITGSATGYTFHWFRNGQELPGESSQVLEADAAGAYRVYIEKNTCLSPMSPSLIMDSWNSPQVNWVSQPADKVVLGGREAFYIAASHNPQSIVWSVDDNDASIHSGEGTTAAVIQFGNTPKNVKITVEVTNQCGTTTIEHTISVEPLCSKARVSSFSMYGQTSQSVNKPLNVNATVGGQTLTMGATVGGGTPPYYYQWYKTTGKAPNEVTAKVMDGVDISGAQTKTLTINNKKVSDSGAYSVAVWNCDASTENTLVKVGDIKIWDVSQAGTGADGSITGQREFDIKSVPENSDKECGLHENRTAADFTKTYEYTFKVKATGNYDLTLWVEDPKSAIESYEFVPKQDQYPTALVPGDNYTVKIKFKESLGKQGENWGTAAGLTEANAIKVYIKALYMNSGNTAELNSLEIKIMDCAGCSSVSDIEGNVYTAAKFGDAGCWMTENLATTKKPNKTGLTSVVPGGAGNATKAKPKASGGEGWGRLYTWEIMMNGQTFETITTQVSKGRSTVQGICPDGWIIPSDYDWNMLEAEIATNPTPYSTNTKVWSWNVNWEKGNVAPGYGYRPHQYEDTFAWGESMKSSRSWSGLPNDIYPSSGTSKQDGNGFDILLAGDGSAFPSDWAYMWTASHYNGQDVWARSWRTEEAATMRASQNMYKTYSVRCIKSDK